MLTVILAGMEFQSSNSYVFEPIPMFILSTRMSSLGIRKARKGHLTETAEQVVLKKRGRRSALTSDDTGVILELRKTRARKSRSFAKVCYR